MRIREWWSALAPPCGPGVLGRVRISITILAGKQNCRLILFQLSLGQSSRPTPDGTASPRVCPPPSNERRWFSGAMGLRVGVFFAGALPSRLPSRSGGSKTARICSMSSFGCACPALYAGKRGLPM
jgi:hypothetical protein